MAAGRKYTDEQISYIVSHYKKDKTTAEIANHTGISERCIIKWASNNRSKYPEMGRRYVAGVGEVRIQKKAGKPVYKEIKNEDGEWRYAGVVERVNRFGPVPVVRTESNKDFIKAHFSVDMNAKEIAAVLGLNTKQVCDIIDALRRQDPSSVGKRKLADIGEVREWTYASGQVMRKIKTEKGWELIKKVKVKSEPKPPKPRKDRYSNSQPIGTKSIRQKDGEPREYIKISDKQWKLIPKEPSFRKPKTIKTKMPTPRKAVDPKKPKSFDLTKNPDEVKVPVTEGGQWVRLDAKTLVYRKNAS